MQFQNAWTKQVTFHSLNLDNLVSHLEEKTFQKIMQFQDSYPKNDY
jgi:hypothetical protein